MSNIASKIADLENLFFQPIPVKPIKVARAVRTGNVTVFLSDKGGIYSTGVQNKCHYMLGSKSAGTELTLDCCVKLGLLTKKAVDQHKAHTIEVARRRDAKWAAENLTTQAAMLGIKLTTAQLKTIKAAKGSEA